jgi:hypothetical protein
MGKTGVYSSKKFSIDNSTACVRFRTQFQSFLYIFRQRRIIALPYLFLFLTLADTLNDKFGQFLTDAAFFRRIYTLIT